MGLFDAFNDPATRPRAIGVTAAIAVGVLAAGYWFWTHRAEVQDDLRKAGHKVGEAAQHVGHAAQTTGHRIGEAAQDAGHRIGNAAHRVGEATTNAGHRVGETTTNAAHRVGESVSSIAHRLGETTSDVAHRIGETTSHAAHRVSETATDVAHKTGEKLSDAAHATGDAITKAGRSVHEMFNVNYKRVSEKMSPIKDRIKAFKERHLEEFFQVEKAAIKDEHNKTLSLETLKGIQELAIKFSENDFTKNLKLNREERRKHLEHNKAHYEEVVIDGIQDFEKIFTENLNGILSEIKVSQDKYEASVEEHVATDQSVALFAEQLYDTFLNRVPAYGVDESHDYDYAVKIHKWLADNYHTIQYRPLRKQTFVNVRTRMLYDRAHIEFGLEEEDFRKLAHTFETEGVTSSTTQLAAHQQKDEETFGNFPKH